MEKFAIKKNQRILIYRSILQQKLTFHHLNLLKRSMDNNGNINFSQNTRSYILKASWKRAKIFDTMPHLAIMFWCWDKQGAEKTSFVQSLSKNKIFGSDLLSVDWVSKITRFFL